MDVSSAILKKRKRQLRLMLKRQVKKLPRSENRKRSNDWLSHGYRRGASAERPTKVWSRACIYPPKNEERRSAGAITMPWWIQLTSGLELLIAVGGLALISFRLAMAFKEWKQK